MKNETIQSLNLEIIQSIYMQYICMYTLITAASLLNYLKYYIYIYVRLKLKLLLL